MNMALNPQDAHSLAKALVKLFEAVDRHLILQSAPTERELEDWAQRLRAVLAYADEVVAEEDGVWEEEGAEVLQAPPECRNGRLDA